LIKRVLVVALDAFDLGVQKDHHTKAKLVKTVYHYLPKSFLYWAAEILINAAYL